jgi:xanthine dehydrogenase accessory factor
MLVPMNGVLRRTLPAGFIERSSFMRFRPLVLVCGADEIGTAVAHRLYRARFRVALAASDDPLILLRGNAFSQAAFSGSFEVEGVTAYKAVVTEALGLVDRNLVPLLTAHFRSLVDVLNPEIVVDTRSGSSKGDLSVGDASLVIGIGEGMQAGVDCDLAVNAARGHDMGRLVFRGGTEGRISAAGEGAERGLVPSVSAGIFLPEIRIGRAVHAGDRVGMVGETAVECGTKGVISALLQEGVEVPEGAPVAEVESDGSEDRCYTISDLGRAVSGGVLEAVVAWTADVGGFPHQ